MQRCHNPNHPTFQKYGKRGIVVCREWRHSFVTFFEDMGPKPARHYSIERINNLRGYSKDNCRWATQPEQLRNTARNRWITYKGETLCITDWALRYKLNLETLRERLNLGWTMDKALTRSCRRRSNFRPKPVMVTLNGRTQNLQSWVNELCLPYDTIWRRLKSGYTPKRALLTPVRKYR